MVAAAPARRPARRGRASTGHQPQLLVDRGRAARRAGRRPRGSACSSTACTSEPNVGARPAGRPSARADASGRRRARLGRGRVDRLVGSSSSRADDLRLAGDAAAASVGSARLSAEYDVRRQSASTARVEARARRGRSAVAGATGSRGARRPRDALEDRAAGRLASARSSSTTSSSPGAPVAASGTAAAVRCGRNSSRCSAAVGVSRVGAHQATTCDWARVSAT